MGIRSTIPGKLSFPAMPPGLSAGVSEIPLYYRAHPVVRVELHARWPALLKPCNFLVRDETPRSWSVSSGARGFLVKSGWGHGVKGGRGGSAISFLR